MSMKEILLEVVEKLPSDAMLVDVISDLEAVEQGLAELNRGSGSPIVEVKSKIAEWAGKESSRRLAGPPG